jgi:hypothetical protein
MRRKYWMLLCLPATCGVALAADNPFVRPPQPMIARSVEIVTTANRSQPPADNASSSDIVAKQDQPSLFAPFDPPPERRPSIYGNDRMAKVTEDRIMIPKLIAPTTSIDAISLDAAGEQTRPDDIGGEALDQIELLPEGFDRSGDWALTSYFWQAPNTFSLPLFFEDVMLERHGHERHPALTPMLAGARFFGTLPMLPYLATVRDPYECYYHLGYYRPGSCAPPLLQRPPYVRKAAIVQGAATAGAFIAIP